MLVCLFSDLSQPALRRGEELQGTLHVLDVTLDSTPTGPKLQQASVKSRVSHHFASPSIIIQDAGWLTKTRSGQKKKKKNN